MAEGHGRTWAFSANLLSSHPPVNRPDVADPDPQPSTFRVPLPIPSESDESLTNVEDDDDETVRGYVLQDVEDADDLEDLEMEMFGFGFIDEDTEQSTNATTNRMGHMALSEADESNNSKEASRPLTCTTLGENLLH